MKAAIHQPQYISWIGFFNKVLRSDIFIYLDDCQYVDRSFQNRNIIFYNGKYRWLTIPIVGKKRVPIHTIRIDNSTQWQKKHADILYAVYKKSPYFSEVYSVLEKMYTNSWEMLVDYLIAYDALLFALLGIKIKKVRASEIANTVSLFSTERLIALCQGVLAGTYLSGSGGRSYIELDKFAREKISVQFQTIPEESQKKQNPAILDFLFIKGPKETKKLIEEFY